MVVSLCIDDVDADTEEYFHDLVEVSPDEEDILLKIRWGVWYWYQTLLMTATALLMLRRERFIAQFRAYWMG